MGCGSIQSINIWKLYQQNLFKFTYYLLKFILIYSLIETQTELISIDFQHAISVRKILIIFIAIHLLIDNHSSLSLMFHGAKSTKVYSGAYHSKLTTVILQTLLESFITLPNLYDSDLCAILAWVPYVHADLVST